VPFFSGVIENFPGHPVGKFIKEGTGTQILSGNNTYSGTTTVTGGTLQIGNAGTTGTLGAGAVILAGNANLKFVRSSHTIISNAISGTGNVSANITSDGGVAGNLIVDSTFNLDKGSGSSGLIDLRADGNVTLSKAIITTNQTGNAVKLIAGQALGAGTKTGGNVIVNNLGAITLGSGGIAALYTGSIDGTTGISVMSDSGSGKFRYNSDETQRNYTKSLNQSNGTINSGVSIIYREAPEIKVTSKSTVSGALTYNGLVRANPNADVTNNLAETGVLKNGDATSLTGTLGLAYQKGSEPHLKMQALIQLKLQV
jgi:autotransporter-associated beta strand protein